MSRRFLYFLPGSGGADTRRLTDVGLLSRFQGHGGVLLEHGVTEIDSGPGASGRGRIVAAGARPPDYDPKTQQWVEGKNFWLAIESQPPMPGDLEREIGIRGKELVLNDGNAWRVPIVRRWDRQTLRHVPNVPTALSPVLVEGKYQYRRQVVPEFRKIDELAERVWAGFCQTRTLSIEQLFSDAAAMLAVNYRLGEEEAGLLGLLDERVAMEVLKIAVDLEAVQQQSIEFADEGLQAREVVIQDEE